MMANLLVSDRRHDRRRRRRRQRQRWLGKEGGGLDLAGPCFGGWIITLQVLFLSVSLFSPGGSRFGGIRVAAGAVPSSNTHSQCVRSLASVYAPFPKTDAVRSYAEKYVQKCDGTSGQHKDWTERAIVAYTDDAFQQLHDVALRRKDDEAWVFTSLIKAAAQESAFQTTFTQPNHFVVLAAQPKTAAFAVNRMARAARADHLLVVLGDVDAKKVPSSLVNAAFDILRANANVALVGVGEASYGTFGREAKGKSDGKVVLARYANSVGGLVAVVRRRELIEVGMFAERQCVSGNACDAHLLVDLSARMWRAGFSVAAVQSGSSVSAKAAAKPPSAPSECALESSPSTEPKQFRGKPPALLLKAAKPVQPCIVEGGSHPPTAGHSSSPSCVESMQSATGCRLASPLPAPPSCRSKDPRFSIIAQYFRRPNLLKKVFQSLAASADTDELWVNNDSRSELSEFASVLGGKSNAFVVLSPNVHEIRGYNRLALLSSGTYLAFVQDDDVAPQPKEWLSPATSLFRRYNRTGLIGGFRGRMDFGTQFDARHNQMTGIKYGARLEGEPGRKKPERIVHKDEASGRKFMFIYKVSMGPMLARRGTFLRLGLFHTAYSCPGAPGIGFDYEFSIRCWKTGAHVGLYYSRFKFNAGDHGSTGTRAAGMWQHRMAQEKRNNMMLFDQYPGFHPKAGTRKAQDTLLQLLPRSKEYKPWTDKSADALQEGKHGMKSARREAERNQRRSGRSGRSRSSSSSSSRG